MILGKRGHTPIANLRPVAGFNGEKEEVDGVWWLEGCVSWGVGVIVFAERGGKLKLCIVFLLFLPEGMRFEIFAGSLRKVSVGQVTSLNPPKTSEQTWWTGVLSFTF